ncbi:Eco57I restriction-modification methylase domain-containing protein [Pseudoalteromonas fenneropenaei]|uniref:site-specific DNA-methyltransferase (adenine-specific) n=1 Tax=Pseudoalteromonas fenneropenaei TaxID=1737459 RepID=A0ABV7CPC9_9GAMM
MRTALERTLRSTLEKTVEKARDIVEVAVVEALTRLGVAEGAAPSYLNDGDKKLRTRLRAHGRQLGDVLSKDTGKQETELLVNEMAYEHWHRMLFARFLEQSQLLMYDEYTSVTLQDCHDLAQEDPDVKDGWELAGRLAQKMLPQIFRADSPVFEVKLSINHVHALEELIAGLHPDTFQASDALGWCYQFWQNKKKKQVNESGVKIGAKELSPVTQLFTEPYMVSFLLDNALGAWWAKRRLTQDDLAKATNEQELRNLASIPGVPLEYLRFVQDESTKTWRCAAGDFDKWPEDLSEFKTLDPCCGSGHFLVAKFLMLVPIRMELEGLTAKEAIDKVLAQNIHGLELDQRCVELAAFALALEAWRYPNSGGYRQLPELHLACSGISINEAQKEWKNIAKGNEELERAVGWMKQTFKNAPILGSLIEPKPLQIDILKAPWELLQNALKQQSNASNETLITAQGLAKSATLLSRKYEWVVTNVPYLKAGDQCETLKSFCENYYPESKYALETTFMERNHKLLNPGGVCSIVTQQYWLFLKYYSSLREKFIKSKNLGFMARVGKGAFEEISGEVVNICLQMTANESGKFHKGIEFEDASVNSKEATLQNGKIEVAEQLKQLDNPDYRISFELASIKGESLSKFADFGKGSVSGDGFHYLRKIWEFNTFPRIAKKWLNSPDHSNGYSGRSDLILWNDTNFNPTLEVGFAQRGERVYGKKGIAIGKAGKFRFTPYEDGIFDDNVAVIIPDKNELLPALWEYCISGQLQSDISKLDKKMSVTAGTFTKVKLELDNWQNLAKAKYPYGLPKPYSNDCTQWLYHGHPCASVVWDEEKKTTTISDLREDDTVLQVAVARLLGYRWPAELDTDMELASEMREIIAQNKVFDGLVDDDGIVCIPAIRGEKPAIDRLEAILHAAYGDKWSATVLNNLLKSVKSRDLNIWLRDKFFEQHCKLFQHRPFIWHIWDGLPDGFSALVNYHQLDYKGLERLIYTYLDDWISTQIQLEKEGDEGAELRLAAARNLRKQLEDILVGEKGLDIFVRWKSLAEQPIGWNPDLNDGVRLNIRPFMYAKDVAKKGAGVLRAAPNIHWKKDRGTDVESAPWYDLGLEYGGNQGDRINDHHLTLAEKKAARAAKDKAC